MYNREYRIIRSLVTKFAKVARDRMVRRVRLALQGMKGPFHSGDDSGLISAWDELCVQMQGEMSVVWDVYDETARMLVVEELRKAAPIEIQAMWLETDEGEYWLSDDDDELNDSGSSYDASIPYIEADVVSYVVDELYHVAMNWSNQRIRKYLDEE